jgi:hypothetical protein
VPRLFVVGAAVVFGCMAWTATEWPLSPLATTILIIALAIGLGSIAASAIVFTRARRNLPEARVRKRDQS